MLWMILAACLGAMAAAGVGYRIARQQGAVALDRERAVWWLKLQEEKARADAGWEIVMDYRNIEKELRGAIRHAMQDGFGKGLARGLGAAPEGVVVSGPWEKAAEG